MVVSTSSRLRPRVGVPARGSGTSCATSSSRCRTSSGAWRSAASSSTAPSLQALSNRVRADIAKHEGATTSSASPSTSTRPKRLEVILFDDLKLPVLKRTKTGRSTDARGARGARQQNPLPAKILEVRSLPQAPGHVPRGPPALIGRQERAHPRATARRWPRRGASRRPAPTLQNIPIRTPLGREIHRPSPRRRVPDPRRTTRRSRLRVLAHPSRTTPSSSTPSGSTGTIHSTASEIFKVPASAVTKDMRIRRRPPTSR